MNFQLANLFKMDNLLKVLYLKDAYNTLKHVEKQYHKS